MRKDDEGQGGGEGLDSLGERVGVCVKEVD